MFVPRTAFVLAATAGLFLHSGVFAGAFAGEVTGPPAPLGNGTVASYAVTDGGGAPVEIGVAFSAGAFDGLPETRNLTSRCFDTNGDGAIEAAECEGDYQTSLALPEALAGRADIPFRFVMLNWNPQGHDPAPWNPPHFDMHFYQIPESAVDAMRPGPCGYFLNCDDYATAIAPVPAKYVNPQFANVQAAVQRMGNHLIDTLTPELSNPGQPFTHTWIYGAYGGSVIFHEIMVTRSFLMLGGAACQPILQPEAWQTAGYYPTSYCFRPEAEGGVRVYLTGFEMRAAG